MQSLVLTEELAQQVTPRAGRVVLKVPPPPENINALIVPGIARVHKQEDTHQHAQVVSVGYGRFWEDGKEYPGVNQDDFAPGDWIVFRPLLLELNAPYVITDVRRVDARIVEFPSVVEETFPDPVGSGGGEVTIREYVRAGTMNGGDQDASWGKR